MQIKVSNLLFYILNSFFFLIIWWLVSAYFSYDLIPKPDLVLKETLQLFFSKDFLHQLALSLRRILLGFSITFVISIIISILIENNKFFKNLLKIPLLLGLIVPALIFAFICIVLFGVRELTGFLIVFLITAPQLIIIISSGIKNLNPEYIEVGKVFQISKKSQFLDVILPQITPSLLAATKTGISNAWKATIIAEIFALSNGIGSQIYYQFGIFSLKGVLSWTVAFLFVMGLIYAAINLLEKRLLKWQKDFLA